ncbi:hypothetical protein RUMTOR_01907 [[Ruminococcus] torques ATCC 27756]|uniref:Uncharacterized protein n=1 Tax=[Ruminococcus] torques ATCC 27756 TaxID=411460 RepID=A5KNT2_9FIRM|nr:hypothetical protein RUMTOR_01907 [[Ruminococcus] torques ATCC 27756]
MFLNIQLIEKIKKFSLGGCKNASQRFVLCKGILDRKNKKIFIKNLYLCPSSFEYM